MNSASLAWLTHCKVCRNSPLNNSKTLSSTLSANSAGGSRRTILRSSSPDALANTPNAQFVAPPTSRRKQGQTACSNQAPGVHEVCSRLLFCMGYDLGRIQCNTNIDEERNGCGAPQQPDENQRAANSLNYAHERGYELGPGNADIHKSTDAKPLREQKFLNAFGKENPADENADEQNGLCRALRP